MTRIRAARTGDAEAISRIQIASWRAAYRSIMPAEFLATLDEAERADRWRGRIGPANPAEAPIFVAVDNADAVLGFVNVGPVRDDDVAPAGRGEVYTLYVEPGAWRRGIGSALLAATDEHWRSTDVRELLLWVFEDNAAARAFYEAQGWAADRTRRLDDFGGAQPAEIRYRRTIPGRDQPR
ncbi:MAG TPA: GNAT family N-acetyltransferase [Candidatus Binatia bacterium]|nr:GNAT family N-acetyltransferase [Candidatus Binatia bacterium]